MKQQNKIAKSQTHEKPEPTKARPKPTHFYYANRDAKAVSLIGDFNEWNPEVHPLRRREDGWWFIEVRLTHGYHRYLFLVDGVPTLDPQATEATIEGSLLQV
ncbi:MAG TPA: hypothetical protein VNN22_20665 [Verrucomicrobiae bacterium]|nr:hypothetical protein [Verrucomicrobiae bacterium]